MRTGGRPLSAGRALNVDVDIGKYLEFHKEKMRVIWTVSGAWAH